MSAIPEENVRTHSRPSDLRITDIRAVTTRIPIGRCPLIRIDTNQGIYGLGEVRDGASKTYALRSSARSSSLAVTPARAAACARSRWP